MDLFVCEHTSSRLLASLFRAITNHYITDEKSRYPLFVALGPGGKGIADGLLELIPKARRPNLIYTEEGIDGAHVLPRSIKLPRKTLICESIVNTGRSIELMRRQLKMLGVEDVSSIALIVRNGARLLPNFYGMTVNQNDKVYFGTGKCPVHVYENGCIRQLAWYDIGTEVNSGVTWIDKLLDDYMYNDVADPKCRTFVIDCNDKQIPVGVLHFRYEGDNEIFVDVLSVREDYQGKKYAAALLRFFEEYCKMNSITRVRMLAISDKVALYRRYGYKETGNKLNLSYGLFEEMEHTKLHLGDRKSWDYFETKEIAHLK